MKHALVGSASQLKAKLARLQKLQRQRERKNCMIKYIPTVASSVFNVIKGVRGAAAEPFRDIAAGMHAGTITQASLESKLRETVERLDAAAAESASASARVTERHALFAAPVASWDAVVLQCDAHEWHLLAPTSAHSKATPETSPA